MKIALPFKRRGTLVISVAILKAAKNGARMTHLLNDASLSYEQFVKYADFLENCGFIKEEGNLYQTTDKGLELIDEFETSSLIRSVLAT